MSNLENSRELLDGVVGDLSPSIRGCVGLAALEGKELIRPCEDMVVEPCMAEARGLR